MPGVPQGSMTNFPQGFAYGLSVRGMPLTQMQPGQTFFVGNGPVLNPNQKPGSNGNRGTFLDPFATLTYAINTACTQGRGDIVFVLPGHAESIPNATTLVMACAGVAVIGLGAGNMRPRLTFTTATTANIPLRAADMSIQNVLVLNNFADVASNFTEIGASVTASVAAGTAASASNPVIGSVMTVTVVGSGTLYPGASVMGTGVPTGTIILSQLTGTTGGVGTYQLNNSFTFASGTITTGAQNFAIDNCEFRDLSSVLNALTIYTTSANAQGSAGLSFTRNTVSSLGTTAATTAIVVGAALDRVTISGNYGNWAILADTAAMLAAGANNITNFNFSYNILSRPNTTSTVGNMISASGTAWTGQCAYNAIWNLDNTAGVWIDTGTKLGFNQNFSPITGAADKSGLINPAAV